ncbi:M20/M25/M40 family metallo-hydrolase [Microbacterium sp. p3-SID336]|uniref:M20/M25/M40 family metallo-hydrolase n=1 Tax=Microbacterium sp. p3-SID336 TaxID=2916212 RepID=UPI0021A76075|nr:M20/M25/M40 family metallo-hydrolase [Microbacterium sp. p3-SID336]MCT1479727.1 M20/M25/M40 family metallo-hydrolase [Microbacterium sp. p3-SID336]
MNAEHHEGADPIGDFLRAHLDEMVERLSAWVAIPSVSADPERRIELARSAHWVAGELRDAGLATTLLPAGDSITVFAEREHDPGAPTVLVYSHHDVRAAKPEEWSETAPFTPVRRDGRLYGRGASDAKGQVLAHVWALRAAEAVHGAPGVNLKLLIDGEEEIGSPHLRQLLEADPERFACDLVVFSDTIQWQVDSPAPVTSMRGTVTATLTVEGPARDVHSGAASGVTLNPALVLAQVLARLHDDGGRIAVPGFYDDVAPTTSARAAELEALPFTEDDWVTRTDTRAIVGEQGFTPKERLWTRPAIEVISLLAGDPEGLERSVIPREATASLSVRTVPDQRIPDVADLLRSFVASVMPPEARYTFEVDEDIAQEPYVSPSGDVLDALERALARGYGLPVQGRMGNAGGGPAEWLSARLGAPVFFLGTGLPEDHWHASDESIDLRMLVRGAATLGHLWQELAGR